MEELWRGPRPCFLEEPSEVVLTYRQPPAPEPEPVTLCYQRPLPACMALPAAVPPPVVVPRNNRRSRRRKRLLIALAVLLVLAMMAATGAGLWYVVRHGLRLPGDVRDFPGTEDGVPPRGGFYWELEEPEDTSITIPAYPTGGDTRLSLSPSVRVLRSSTPRGLPMA